MVNPRRGIISNSVLLKDKQDWRVILFRPWGLFLVLGHLKVFGSQKAVWPVAVVLIMIFLTSPNYIVSADGEVTLSFEHRHAFEGAMWDSGQLWIRVNGGAYADVGKDAFSENGYTDIAIIGNGIAKGPKWIR